MKSQRTRRKQAAPDTHRRTTKLPKSRPTRAQNNLKSILQGTTESFGIWNLSAGPLRFNEAFLSVLGYPEASSPSRRESLQSLIHPDDQAEFQARLNTSLAGKVLLLNCEFRLRTKSGHYRWFEMRGKALRHGSRGAAHELAYALRDIQASKEQHGQIVASYEHLTEVVHASHHCICVVDPAEYRLLLFNKSFEDLMFRAYGVRVKRGMTPDEISAEWSEEWNVSFAPVLGAGSGNFEYSIHSLNEARHVYVQSLVNNGGHVYGFCISGHDVTDQKRVEETLRRSEEQFVRAFREAPLAFALTSLRDDHYIDVNDAYLEATGYSREDLIGKTPYEIGLWVDPEVRMEMVREVKDNSVIRNIESIFRTKSGDVREGLGSAAVIEIDNEPCMLSVVTDITEHKRAIEAFRESEERLRIAIEAGHMYAFQWDLATDIVERSEQSSDMLGLSDNGSRHTKQELIDQMPPEDRQQFIEATRSVTPEHPDYKTVFRLLLRDGRTAWFEESGRAIFGDDGKLRKVIGITSDVTETHASERALRELSGRLITSEEEERRRVARELHDHIGQEAALICVQAQRLDSGMTDEEHTTRSEIRELYKRIKVLASDISKLSHRLHSSELSFLGLSVAGERLCRDFANQYGIDVDYHAEPLPTSFDSAKSLCLYRVLEEALQNVAKHSQATRVTVELKKIESELVLKVRDNGHGFDVEKTGPGLGLLSMRERLNFVGGRFAITSTRGSSTIIRAVVTA
jgi:PAS domain S-box-containing protein